MQQSFLIMKEPCIGVHPESPPNRNPESSLSEAGRHQRTPEAILRSCGFRTVEARTDQNVMDVLPIINGIVLHIPFTALSRWVKRAEAWRTAPLFWWCEETGLENGCELEYELDGILFPKLTQTQLHWVLLHGKNRYLQRIQWQKEREQLLAKLVERKIIDRAKALICEIKSVSEADAHEILRKQAMNDRKRMIDVAASIVRVYELLRLDANSPDPKRPKMRSY